MTFAEAKARQPETARRRFLVSVIIFGWVWWAHKDSNLGPAD
jgi:hypothetical protein